MGLIIWTWTKQHGYIRLTETWLRYGKGNGLANTISMHPFSAIPFHPSFSVADRERMLHACGNIGGASSTHQLMAYFVQGVFYLLLLLLDERQSRLLLHLTVDTYTRSKDRSLCRRVGWQQGSGAQCLLRNDCSVSGLPLLIAGLEVTPSSGKVGWFDRSRGRRRSWFR